MCPVLYALVRDMCPSTNGATNLSLFEVESYERLGAEGRNLIDQLAASVVGRKDGG